MSILDQIMGVEEAAEVWGYSPGYIKNLCADGKVEARKIGKTWIIAKEQNNPREETNMTTVNYNSKDYTLTQEAYMAGTHDQPQFEAHAVDGDGNEYMVQWDVRDNWREMDDQSDMCDWSNPASVDAL